MAELSIYEEEISEFFLERHQFKIKGWLQYAYSVHANGEDYVNRNKDLLLQFLIHQNKYPLFLTFRDDFDEFSTFLNENKIEYTLNVLQDNNMGHYFTAKIQDPDTLALLLNETYWLASINNFYCISFSNNLAFDLVKVKAWIMVINESIPTFKMNAGSTFITTNHDGDGFCLFSNEEKYDSLDSFLKSLPKELIITYLNGDPVNE